MSKPARFVRKLKVGDRFLEASEEKIDDTSCEIRTAITIAKIICPRTCNTRSSRKNAGMRLGLRCGWSGVEGTAAIDDYYSYWDYRRGVQIEHPCDMLHIITLIAS